MNTIKVTIIIDGDKVRAREVNPIKKPNRHAFKYHYESRCGRFNSQLYKRHLSDWMDAESSLRTWDIEPSYVYMAEKEIPVISIYPINSLHTAEIINESTVRIID